MVRREIFQTIEDLMSMFIRHFEGEQSGESDLLSDRNITQNAGVNISDYFRNIG